MTHARTGALAAAALAAFLPACQGGGLYNYDITYHPLKAEKPFYDGAEELNYVEVKSDPLKYKGARLSWFGTVKEVAENADGTLTLSLEYRTYHPRHLCDDQLEMSSCRVTVSSKALGTFTVTLAPSGADAAGKHRIAYKSLLHVYGTPTGDYDGEGGPVLTCDYHRHWPAGTYVTTSAAEFLKQ